MIIPVYNGKTFTPIYIPQYHSYSTSIGHTRDICEPECSVGDYIILGVFGIILLLVIGVLVVVTYDSGRDF